MLTPRHEAIVAAVHSAIRNVLANGSGTPAQINGADRLNGTLGLSSLDLAFLVAELETTLAVNPFDRLVSITAVRTVDDLVGAYCKAFMPNGTPDADAAGLEAAGRRAELRRARQDDR
jgi:acyl carrier protein